MNLKDLSPNMQRQAIEQYPDLGEKGKPLSPSKYRNAKGEALGMTFQSGHEAGIVAGLILAEEQHKIFSLRLQVEFPLPGGVKYRADAVFAELIDGKLELVVLDSKAFDVKTGKYRYTEAYKIKKRQMTEIYGVDIREC